MPDLSDSYTHVPLLAGAGFFEAIAAAIFAEGRRFAAAQDLSAFRVIVPSMAQAAEIRHAMLNEAGLAGVTYLLPQFLTLEKWAESSALNEVAGESVGVLRESERHVLLYEALRKRGWFDENALWEIAAEMCTLFDELTRASITLPADEAMLLAQLADAYALRSSLPLAFEARVVHETWRAVNFTGRISPIARYHLCLFKLAEEARASNSLSAPTFVLLTDSPEIALSTAERDFFAAYATHKPLTVFYPCACQAGQSALLATLASAWPEALSTPILARANALAAEHPISPLAEGLQLIACDGAEQEAQAVVAQVGHYVNQGRVRIALIAQDRLTARRVRALLEREKMLINDESGWKLSTSRAAATLDALLETVTGGAYYQDFLDLLKSPFIFSHLPLSERRAVVFAVESAIRRASVKGGYKAIAKCVAKLNDSSDISPALKNQAVALINAIESAANCLRTDFLSIADWLNALQNALQEIGALRALASDAAGQKILDLLVLRRIELNDQSATFSRDAWRDWLNRELESAYFKDAGIKSSIVMTSLKSALLRRFDAAILIGGDDTRLVPASVSSTFFNTSVRRELGLSTSEDAQKSLCRDLELLLCFVPRVAVTWQRVRDGEANLLAPALDRLSLLNRLAWHDDLKRTPLPARPESAPGAETRPMRATQAAPFVPVAQASAYLPSRVSVSAYKSLVDCPYLFFARYILGLGELDEVAEKMEKRDYGELVHRVLEVFHQRHPLISALSPEEALAELRHCVDEVFAPVIKDDFLSIAWKFRWEKKLDSYLDWQRERETEGWRFFASEQRAKHLISLDDGSSLELYGRIDRVDKREWRNSEQHVITEVALYDYKAQSSAQITKNLKDDIQLPVYTLFEKDAVEAGYVALDSTNVEMKSSGGDEADLLAQAAAQEARLRTCFSALRQGAPLPAQGIDAVCGYCTMSGLCRRDHVC